ncbi:aspartyl protease family protein [Termitidicoccus mucosus]|uniref:PDZ domain-containing protein n=1 Tax=Termitidicoccus mucosus TaxID=1184151 RepID=A0A178IJJ2_9BACT|nr:hypothetical protein AW736_13610 [Opitutaceae bacterium TSB47]
MPRPRQNPPAAPAAPVRRPVFASRAAAGLLLAALVLAFSGCSNLTRLYKRESRPGQTKVRADVVEVKSQVIGSHFVVEAKGDKRGPWRFLIDTGSSVTLVSEEFYKANAMRDTRLSSSSVGVRSASGQVAYLQSGNVREIQLGNGGARFLNVPVLLYNCGELSAHLGVKIDGVLGFPLFRDTVFTLDYPRGRMTISPARREPPAQGRLIAFNNDQRTPIIPVQLGGETFAVLIDSGSDAPLMLNPVGLHPRFSVEPRPGAAVGTLTGDRNQVIGRLAGTLNLGGHQFEQPLADLTDQLSAIGGKILCHFRVTFMPARNQMLFYRDSDTPVTMGPLRSPGLSFSKTPAYWRVLGVVPGSPAEARGVRKGDLVSRINGEPVSNWSLQRFDAQVRHADEITFTFVRGSDEAPVIIPTFNLVP